MWAFTLLCPSPCPTSAQGFVSHASLIGEGGVVAVASRGLVAPRRSSVAYQHRQSVQVAWKVLAAWSGSPEEDLARARTTPGTTKYPLPLHSTASLAPDPGLQPHRRGQPWPWLGGNSDWADSISKRPATGPTIRSSPNHLGRHVFCRWVFTSDFHLSISPSDVAAANDADT